MAKVLVEDHEEGTRVPFLRGILTRSLQEAGLSFDDAFALATTIRNTNLADTSLITTNDLRSLVVKQLEKSFGRKIVDRYQISASGESQIQVIHPDGQITAFSEEQQQRCLETVGLNNAESTVVIEKMHLHLSKQNIRKISSQHIAYLTYRCLSQTHSLGPTVARRYMVWVDFVRSGRPLILLIGGTAGCGKSTIATALANRLDIVRTQSTDMLREVMRTMIPKKLLPVLHVSSFSAWRELPPHEGDISKDPEALLADGYRTQADLLSVPIEAVIQRALRERVSLILEGVHIRPSLIDHIEDKGDAVIVPIMLGVIKRKQLQKRIKGRGTEAPKRASERYLENFDQIWSLQTLLLSEADRADIPIVINEDRDKVVREIMRFIIDGLSEKFKSSPKEVFGD
jgi:2-phosphoglycerate kinase